MCCCWKLQQDILEVKAAIYGINKYFESAGVRLPLQVQVTLDTTGRMLLGTDIAAVLAILEALPVDVIGLNCSTGPDYMREPVRYLTSHTRKPISVIPNAGLPINVDGVACYPMEPLPMADTLSEFVTELGVSVVGGCCGTTPDHLRVLVEQSAQSQAQIALTWTSPRSSLPRCAPLQCIKTRRRTSSANASTRRAARRPSNCCWPMTMRVFCKSRAIKSKAARTPWTCAWR